MWRCISYSRRGFSIAMFVYRRVSAENWCWREATSFLLMDVPFSGRIFYVSFREVASGGDLKITPAIDGTKILQKTRQFLVWKPPWRMGYVQHWLVRDFLTTVAPEQLMVERLWLLKIKKGVGIPESQRTMKSLQSPKKSFEESFPYAIKNGLRT